MTHHELVEEVEKLTQRVERLEAEVARLRELAAKVEGAAGLQAFGSLFGL